MIQPTPPSSAAPRAIGRWGFAVTGLLAAYLLLTYLSCRPGKEPQAADFQIDEPAEFARLLYPAANPSTAAGVELGRRLFYDPILSADSTISCQSCHRPELAFTDGGATSTGIGGRRGRRSAPSLTNVGYLHQTLFWDGRSDDLETQALHPVAAPDEMGGDWPTIIQRLRRHPDYGKRLTEALQLAGPQEISPDHVGRALAQFQRSLISSDSKYDRVQRGEAEFTPAELRGWAIFFDADENLPDAECGHCHNAPHFTNQEFFNNGLDTARSLGDFADKGRGAITGHAWQNGLFRTPSLRNVAVTAPYMHDGRFSTLEEVIDHYNTGGAYAENVSPNVRPLHLSEQDKADLVTFLGTLTDSVFLAREAYGSPF